jgi:quercetin dioxygenase-like cupin family protein
MTGCMNVCGHSIFCAAGRLTLSVREVYLWRNPERRSKMRVLKMSELEEKPMDTATPIAGWTGGAVSRTRQAIIGDGQSENFRCNVVNFRVGATTGWHVHDCDQILVVTAGKGKVASETEERDITVGDVVHIKAGERHWHGASATSPLSHITVTTVGSTSKH